ncbi:MAG: DUF2470 domain-containing protein [Pseudomonadota bacterium]
MAPFDTDSAATIARYLIHERCDAALGTLNKDGAPNVSHAAVATLTSGTPLVLMSDLAVHTHNVRRDARASLLFVAETAESADTNTRARLTLSGTMAPAPDRAYARHRFVRRHPDAEAYVDFGDMHLMMLQPDRAYLVAGFGRITTVAIQHLTAEAGAVATLAEIDKGACEHMDEDHADALAAMAGAPEAIGEWRSGGCDPRGIDLVDTQGRTVRVEYAAPIDGPRALRKALKVLADEARARND